MKFKENLLGVIKLIGTAINGSLEIGENLNYQYRNLVKNACIKNDL